MNIYQSVVDYLLDLSMFGAWQEMSDILKRSASGRPRDWQLPIIACQAVGGPSEAAIPASAALACTQLSIILVDDMLDDDPRGEFLRIGSGRAANLAIAFQAAGIEALFASQTGASVRQNAVNSLNRMMLSTARGQDMDIQNPTDENSYWRVVASKSAPFFACAIHLGALMGNATQAVAANLEQLGRLYGEMIQIHDDLNDTLALPANPDWLQGRRPLPILFAQLVEHPERVKFVELCQNIAREHAVEEAQAILIRCGAISYCIDELIHRHRKAEQLLHKTPLANQETIQALLEELIAPVRNVFKSMDISRDILSTAARPLNSE